MGVGLFGVSGCMWEDVARVLGDGQGQEPRLAPRVGIVLQRLCKGPLQLTCPGLLYICFKVFLGSRLLRPEM